MRLLLTFLVSVNFVAAQSHPRWWNYAAPNATSIVGIDWQIVRRSPFADPIDAELWGDLGFPELPCLRNARQILVSSPDLLGMMSGNFAGLENQVGAKHFKPMTYRGVDMWFATEKDALSIARVNEQLVLIGEPRTLEMAVDRGMSESKNYSPLLARAAKFALKDLWVVAAQLPDELANRFVPLELEAQGFEGSLTVRDGLELDALLAERSEKDASLSADKLRAAMPGWPAIMRGLQVTVEEDSIRLTLEASREEVAAALRGPEPLTPAPETIRVETPTQVERVVVEKVEAAPVETVVVAKPVEPVVVKVPEKPLVIKITGLDEGPREIVLPVVKVEKRNP